MLRTVKLYCTNHTTQTAVANRTARYLAFFHGAEVEVFNVGDKRRRAKGYMKGEEYDFRNRKNMDQRMKYVQKKNYLKFYK